MTQEIIEMARDSGMELYGLGKDRARFVHHLEAFANLVAAKALAEHAMQEVQRLGQEIEQEPCVHAKNPKGCYRIRCQLGDKCVDDEMSFRTAPPQRTWVGLIDEDIGDEYVRFEVPKGGFNRFEYAVRAIEAKLKEKNT